MPTNETPSGLPATWYDDVAADGEPLAADWRQWEELRGRLAALSRCELLDMVVVGERSWWALLGGRSNRAA
jgi:hypothetical protein